MNNRLKPLTLEETKLKEEMKERCLNKGQYIDEKAEDKFKMLCRLEDFEAQYFELLEEIRDLEFIIGLRQKRNLINKFDKEYDEEDKKKNPNRTYAGIIPDAEEVYKRYYEMKNKIDKAIEYINQLEHSDWICFGRKILLEILKDSEVNE